MKNDVMKMGYRWSKEYIESQLGENQETLCPILVYRLEKALGNNISWKPDTAEIIMEKNNYQIPENIDEVLINIISELSAEYICNF